MNWKTYLYKLTENNKSEIIHKSAIIGREDGKILACTTNLELNRLEIQDLLKICKDPLKAKDFIATILGGIKYYIVQSTDKHIQAHSTEPSEFGLMIGITSKSLIIGIGIEKKIDLIFEKVDELSNEIKSSGY